MKVLYITPTFYPAIRSGGPAVSNYILLKAIANKGVIVDVITTTALLEDKNSVKVNQWITYGNLRVKYFPYYFKDTYAFSPQLLLAVMNESKNYDVVHMIIVWSFTTFAGSLSSIVNKKPYVISLAGNLYEDAMNMGSKWAKKIYFYLLARHLIDKASLLHCTTEDERIGMAPFLRIKKQSTVIPFGVDLMEYKVLPEKGLFKKKYSILKDKRYILFLGRVHPKKGLDILVKAFNELVKEKEYRDLFLVVAGPGEEGHKKDFKKQLKNSNLLDRTLFTGTVLGQDKLSAFVDAEMFVLPSYSEDLSMATVEAMACKTPIVISKKVGISKLVEESNAGLVVNLNPIDLWKGMKILLENTNLGKDFTKNGRKLVEEKFDLDIVTDIMIKTYEEIIKQAK